MSNHVVGQVYSLLAAITWAVALVLFKRSGDHVGPVGLNLFKNAVALILLAATLGLLTVFQHGDAAASASISLKDLAILIISGVIGIALADTIFFHALNLIGVGLLSIVDCAYSPFAILFCALLLDERLTAWHYLGALLVVAGVLTAARHPPPANRTRAQITGGIVLAVLAVAMMAFGIVIAKPTLERAPIVWSATIRLAAGSVILALFALARRNGREDWAVFRPSKVWRHALPGSVLGAYVCLLFWMTGFKYTYGSVAAVLNQTSVIFQAVLAALILKEPFGRRQALALAIAFVGVVLVTLADHLSPGAVPA